MLIVREISHGYLHSGTLRDCVHVSVQEFQESLLVRRCVPYVQLHLSTLSCAPGINSAAAQRCDLQPLKLPLASAVSNNIWW